MLLLMFETAMPLFYLSEFDNFKMPVYVRYWLGNHNCHNHNDNNNDNDNNNNNDSNSDSKNTNGNNDDNRNKNMMVEHH